MRERIIYAMGRRRKTLQNTPTTSFGLIYIIIAVHKPSSFLYTYLQFATRESAHTRFHNFPLIRDFTIFVSSYHHHYPRRACAARVTVLGPSVSQCVHDYSRTEGASERYQQLQRNKRSKIKKAILLKRRRSRSRNWHYSGPHCVTQPIN